MFLPNYALRFSYFTPQDGFVFQQFQYVFSVVVVAKDAKIGMRAR